MGKDNRLTHRRGLSGGEGGSGGKRPRAAENGDFFDGLPDELVISILSKLSASAERPSDLIAVLAAYPFFFIFGSGGDLCFCLTFEKKRGFFLGFGAGVRD